MPSPAPGQMNVGAALQALQKQVDQLARRPMPAGGGLTHATPATQRRAWLGTTGGQSSSGYLTWSEAGELKTGSPDLSGAILDVDWILWDPANPTLIQVKQDGIYAISFVINATFTNLADGITCQGLTSSGWTVVPPIATVSPYTPSQGAGSAVISMAASETFQVFKNGAARAGGAPVGTVTVIGANLEIAQII